MSNQTSAQWQAGDTILNQYRIIGISSQNEFGEVYRARHLGWNLDLAIHSLRANRIEAIGGSEAIKTAVEAWSNLGLHPHLASSYYVRWFNEQPLIFSEQVSGGSLRQWIFNRRLYANGSTTALRRILDIAIQIAWGLHFIHEQSVIHKNLATETILLTSDGIAKITEVGLAKHAPYTHAPEQTQICSPQTDLWSWGLVLLEMFAGERTWTSGLVANQSLDRYLAGVTTDIPRMPASVVQLLRQCFQPNPADRPTDLQTAASQLQSIYQTVTGSPYPRRQPSLPQTTPQHLNNRALALWDLGEREVALQLWQQALDLQPQHLTSLYNRGLLWWRVGGSDDRELIHQLTSHRPHPNDWQTDYFLSLIHQERGDYATALHLLEGIQAKGIQPAAISTLVERLQPKLPEARRFLPEFSDRVSAFQRQTSHRIVSLAFSPNSRFVVSGGDDQTIRIWDISSGRCLYTFTGHQGRVTSIAFSPDGNQLLSGSEDKTLKLWNLAATTHLFTFGGAEEQRPGDRIRQMIGAAPRNRSGNGHRGAVRSVAFSPDRRHILSGSDDATIKLWDASSGKCLQTHRAHRGPVFAVAFSPSGHRALSAGADQSIKLWEVATGRVVQTLDDHQCLTAAVFSPDGKYVLAGDTPIKLWDLAKGTVVQTFADPGVECVSFSTDQHYILSGSGDGSLRLWEIATGRCLRTFDAHESRLQAIALSPDGHYAVSTDTRSLKLWSIHSNAAPYLAPLQLSQVPNTEMALTGNQVYEQAITQAEVALAKNDALSAAQHIRRARSQTGYERGIEAIETWCSLYRFLPRPALQSSWQQANLARHTAPVTALAISPDARFILSGSDDKTLKRWDLTSQHCTLSFEALSPITALVLSPDGTQALSASQTLQLWDTNTGECLQSFSTDHPDSGQIQAIAFHPNGRYAISSENCALKLWHVSTGRCLRSLEQHQSPITSLAVSPDGRFCVSGSTDSTLYLWEMATGEWRRSFAGHTAAVRTVAISPDNRYIASGSDDSTIKLWSVATGECLRSFSHSAAVCCLLFTPDGRYIVSGSDDSTVKLWAVMTTESLLTLNGHTAPIRAISISPDSRYIASASNDHSIKLWQLDWELSDTLPTDWDEAASPYLEAFLTLHTPTAPLPDLHEPSPADVTQALTPIGTPVWTESDFSHLIETLQYAGYGWLRPEGVRQQLISRTKIAAQAIPKASAQVTPTAFATEFATAFNSTSTSEELPAKVILTVIEGSLKGEEFVFSDHAVRIIGRAKDCHLLLPNDEHHKTVSRYHCLLDIDPPTVRIRDLGSLHGTYVNGQIIGRRNPNQTPEQGMQINFVGHDLHNGDEIRLGKTVFRVSVTADDATDINLTANHTAVDQTAMIEPTPIHFLVTPTPSATPSVTPSVTPDVTPNITPSAEPSLPTIAGYTVLRSLQQTETTATYLGNHTETNALVTIKLHQPEKLAHPSSIEACLQSLEPLKMLQHPNLIRLRQVGHTNGKFFFISDYFEGVSIAERFRQQGAFSPAEAINIVLQLLDGLHYAHHAEFGQPNPSQAGFVHGSLTPANLIYAEGSRVAKIADYGITTILNQAGLGIVQNATFNLSAFMPRQQAIDFKYAQPDQDVWSIAACLYYMLTGNPPRDFNGKDPYLVLLQTDTIPIRQQQPKIPSALAELIDLALVDNPEIYFKHAVALKQALVSIVGNFVH